MNGHELGIGLEGLLVEADGLPKLLAPRGDGPEIGQGLGRIGVFLKVVAEGLLGAGEVTGLQGLAAGIEQVLRRREKQSDNKKGQARRPAPLKNARKWHPRPVYSEVKLRRELDAARIGRPGKGAESEPSAACRPARSAC